MKYLSFFFLIFLFSFSSIQAQNKSSKKTVEAKFWADGVCVMCQNRIEKALDVPGVRFATWDKESKTVTVIYRSDKVQLKELKTRVAEAGHKTREIDESKEAYQELPNCCKYADGVKKH